MVCTKMQREVLALAQEFPDKVAPQNVDATVEPGKAEVRSFGFKNHGLVIHDASGTQLFKQADHTVKIEDVRAAIQKALSG